MVMNGRAIKRAKRRVTADVVHDFEEASACPCAEGPFRTSVVAFLQRFAREPPPPSAILPLPPQLRPWRASFRLSSAVVFELDVVEEDVARARFVYCDHCRVVGWSGHPVCGKRYNFIIRNEGNPASLTRQVCFRCGFLFDPSDLRCINCNYELSAEDMEDWSYRQLEDNTHLLHGVVHTNGFGHLLRVNGREGGSKNLTGCEIMDFWDRLCKMLRVRKISVMDISKKYGLEYRLLHAITTGKTWYGKWGYGFGAGSFALTEEGYLKAVDTLSNLSLSRILLQSRGPRTQLHDLISLYQSLSEQRLNTVRDLFCLVVGMIHDAHRRGMRVGNNSGAELGMVCAWTIDDVKQVDDTMLKILRAAGVGRWISWRTLRGATCHCGASSVLLDYCLKGLAGKVTDDGLVVVSRCNADTNTIEYRLSADFDHQHFQAHHGIQGAYKRRGIPDLCGPTEEQLVRDLRFLYQSLLNPETMNSYKTRNTGKLAMESARKLVDCKQFVKNYDNVFLESSNPPMHHVWCEVLLLDQPRDYTAPPAELVILPGNANLGDLKFTVTRAFQETYLIFQKFQVEDVVNLGRISDRTTINLLLGNNCTITVKGRCNADHLKLGQFCKERGTENWTVDCVCGAQDDDGERMLACDSCGVWRHTRCMGIEDHDEVPKKFNCWKCDGPPKVKVQPRKPLAKRSRDGDGTGEHKNDIDAKETIIPLQKRCKDDVPGDGRCKGDVMSPTASCLTDANQFTCLTLVG